MNNGASVHRIQITTLFQVPRIICDLRFDNINKCLVSRLIIYECDEINIEGEREKVRILLIVMTQSKIPKFQFQNEIGLDSENWKLFR